MSAGMMIERLAHIFTHLTERISHQVAFGAKASLITFNLMCK